MKRMRHRFSTRCPGCQKPISGIVTVTYSMEPLGVLADGPVAKVSPQRVLWPAHLVCKRCGIFFKLTELLNFIENSSSE